jgi:hypothetical protein
MRVGRGINQAGKTAGRGVKGQKARTGVAIKGFEGGRCRSIAAEARLQQHICQGLQRLVSAASSRRSTPASSTRSPRSMPRHWKAAG